MEQLAVTARDVNLAIYIAGLLLIFHGSLEIGIVSRIERSQRTACIKILAVLGLFVMSSMIGLTFNGFPGCGWKRVLTASKLTEVFSGTLLAYAGAGLVRSHIGVDERIDRAFKMTRNCLEIQSALLLINLFTGSLYYFDASNIYVRGPLYPFMLLMPSSIMILCYMFRIYKRDSLSQQQMTGFDACFSLLILAVIIQLYYDRLVIIVLSAILTTTTLYILILEDVRDRYEEQMKESMLMRARILSGQIEPHFVSNTLVMIRAMCEPESESFRAITDLSEFVRGGLRVLTETKPIPIEEEMDIVESYLDLQNRRFENSIDVEWDIDDEAFSVPPFSVQIAVENAVIHGIRKSATGGGRIEIGTYLNEDAHVIRVVDDGTGFDADAAVYGTGLSNLRDRVRSMSGGELIIKSEKGEGTEVLIMIPRQAEEDDIEDTDHR